MKIIKYLVFTVAATLMCGATTILTFCRRTEYHRKNISVQLQTWSSSRILYIITSFPKFNTRIRATFMYVSRSPMS